MVRACEATHSIDETRDRSDRTSGLFGFSLQEGSMGIARRHFLAGLVGLAATPALAQQGGMSRATAYAFSFTGLDGAPIRLIDHAGKPILIVNTASRCGFTPQLAGLQELWMRFRERGLMIFGVPSNDFGGQEPGGPEDIRKTAHEIYGVSFPLAAKAEVRGANPHPFYKWASFERPFEMPSWNFHKYLIGRDGRIAASFATEVEPTDPRVIAAIEKALGA
jgi:glutathione peroxidase